MNFIRSFNHFMFTKTYNFFDLILFLTVTKLLEDSLWYLLLYIPGLMFSYKMEQVIKEDNNG